MIVVHAVSGPRPMTGLLRLGMLGALAVGLASVLPGGERLLDMLPFVGETEGETVSYRQQLIEIMVPIILDNPFLGASSYLYSPAVESLRQGQGIVDVVNTYLGIGLYSGLVGLLLFSGFFVTVGVNVWRRMRLDKDADARNLGQALLSVLVGILVILVTVSSITVIPYIYWMIAGVGTAYAFGMARHPASVEHQDMPAIRAARARCTG
jgi:O-antigen ligase